MFCACALRPLEGAKAPAAIGPDAEGLSTQAEVTCPRMSTLERLGVIYEGKDGEKKTTQQTIRIYTTRINMKLYI